MPASGVPGLAYAVVAGNEITATGARGVAKLGGDQSTRQDVAPMRALAAVDDESNEHGAKVSAAGSWMNHAYAATDFLEPDFDATALDD